MVRRRSLAPDTMGTLLSHCLADNKRWTLDVVFALGAQLNHYYVVAPLAPFPHPQLPSAPIPTDTRRRNPPPGSSPVRCATPRLLGAPARGHCTHSPAGGAPCTDSGRGGAAGDGSSRRRAKARGERCSRRGR